MSSLDMSLEDISKAHGPTRGGRGGRGGGGGGRGGGAGPMRNKARHSGGADRNDRAPRQQQPYARAPVQQYAPVIYASPEAGGAQWKHDLYEAPAPAPVQQPQQPVKKISGDTIHVSNLAPDVSDDDVREIFERIGAVKSCVVNFNSQGKSTGTATVNFHKKADAEKAVEDYDDAEVDGRPMKLKLIGTVVSAPVVIKKNKPAPVVAQPQVVPQLAYMPQLAFQQPLAYAPSYQHVQQAPRDRIKQQHQAPAPARGGATRGGRGGSRGGSAAAPARGGAKAARTPRAAPKEVSGEDLDREMDAYHSKSAAPAAATTGQPTSA